MVFAQLSSIVISISEEKCCMLLLRSLRDSWDHFVIVIGSTTGQLKMDEVVAALLLKEMQRKSSKVAKEDLIIKRTVKEK